MSSRSKASSGIEWAPVRIPVSRRLETATVMLVMLGGPLLFTLYLYAVLQSWSLPLRTVAIIYTLWYSFYDYSSTAGGRPSRFVQGLSFWKRFGDYFPAKLHVVEKLDPKKRYVMAVHPHGIIGMSLWATILTRGIQAREALGGLDFRVLTVSANFKLPLWRELMLSLGLIDASRRSVDHVLDSGRSIMVVVGGAKEALDARPGPINLTLDCRKGFVRMALRHGAALCPVFSFGENDLYSQVDTTKGGWLPWLQRKSIDVLGFSLPIPLGRGVFQYSYGLLPFRRELNVVVGRPIPVPKVEEPSADQIAHYHDQYKAALFALYNKHKKEYGHDEVLRIIH